MRTTCVTRPDGSRGPPVRVDLAPRGTIALIDDPAELDAPKLKPKALTLHFEFMFARPVHATSDMIEQHRLLNGSGREQ